MSQAPTRWRADELDLLEDIRERLKDKFLRAAPYPEVVGDRKLIRFIRGHNHVLEKATQMIENFLDWRFENGVDDIRKDIVERRLTPDQFPGADIVYKHCKVVVVQLPTNNGDLEQYLASKPLCVEPFMSPSVFTEIDVEDYIRFRIYCLEYVAMALEQLSDEVTNICKCFCC